MTQLQFPSSDFTIEDMEIGDRERRSNLTIIGTQPSDAGAYGCVAANEPGTSAEQATLTVHGEIDSCTISNVCALCGMYFSVSFMQWFQASCSHQ